MKRSFSWYYFSLNVGAFAGEAGLPILRQSFGFTVAFFSVAGISVYCNLYRWITTVIIAGISLLSTLLFWAGTSFYVKKPHRSTDGNRSQLNSPPAVRLTLKQTVQQLWPIMTIFLPLIVFWALFFQQNSTWIQQGLDMDCYVSSLHIPPGGSCDQWYSNIMYPPAQQIWWLA